MNTPRFGFLAFAIAALAPCAVFAQAGGSEDITKLDTFIINETSPTEAILPSARPVTSVFGTELSALDTPRSVSLLSTQLMKDLDIRGPLDFVRGVSGAFTTSQFGAANLVYLRGQAAEVYQNGVRRTTRSDGMPLSFNGVEAVDAVKGPASVVYGVSSLVGGNITWCDARVSLMNLSDERNFTPMGSIFGNELIQADLPFHVEGAVRYKF